jgi:hypothetical protein
MSIFFCELFEMKGASLDQSLLRDFFSKLMEDFLKDQSFSTQKPNKFYLLHGIKDPSTNHHFYLLTVRTFISDLKFKGNNIDFENFVLTNFQKRFPDIYFKAIAALPPEQSSEKPATPGLRIKEQKFLPERKRAFKARRVRNEFGAFGLFFHYISLNENIFYFYNISLTAILDALLQIMRGQPRNFLEDGETDSFYSKPPFPLEDYSVNLSPPEPILLQKAKEETKRGSL